MEPIYMRMIRNGKINPKTGEAWTVEDVPPLWRENVRKELATDTIEA